MPHSIITPNALVFIPREVHSPELDNNSDISIEVYCHTFHCLKAFERHGLT